MGQRNIIERMLPVIDNFERGLASIPESEKIQLLLMEWKKYISSSRKS